MQVWSWKPTLPGKHGNGKNQVKQGGVVAGSPKNCRKNSSRWWENPGVRVVQNQSHLVESKNKRKGRQPRCSRQSVGRKTVAAGMGKKKQAKWNLWGGREKKKADV